MDFSTHPCFNPAARHHYARIHLPVAPQCNVQCNFCNRKYDCVSESRPGVTSAVLSPGQALAYFSDALERDPRIKVMGIAGPGDPFATPDLTLDTLRRVREAYPEMLLCVASNGLNVAPHAEALAQLKVSHVTITLNAIDPEIGQQIYGWVRWKKRMLRGIEAAKQLLENQLEAIRKLKALGVVVKVNTIVIPGVNMDHIPAVAALCGELGVDLHNCLGLYPVEGSAFENLAAPTREEVAATRKLSGEHVTQMHHCTRCRADAVGLLKDGTHANMAEMIRAYASLPIEPTQDRPYVAVTSQEGALVNQHLGEAQRLWIYARGENGPTLVEQREAPLPGGGEHRWEALATRLKDCAAILVGGAGESPTGVLAQRGVRTIVTEGLIETLIDSYYRGQALPPPRGPQKCGVGCSGNGMGCG